MSRPVIPQAKRTYLQTRISSGEVGEIKLNRLTDSNGEALSMADFGSIGYLTINPGSDTTEVISFTGFTVNADNTVTIDTGIVRGLAVVSDFAAGGYGKGHSSGTPAIISNNPQFFEAMLDYMESLANAGAADASINVAGIVQEATTAEIDADTGEGTTTRRLFANPAKLAASKYGTRLPSEVEKNFLGAATGSLMPYCGDTTPTGFLAADGVAFALDTYPALAAVLLGKYGLPTGEEFTGDAGTDIFNKTAHGLSDGERVMLYSDDTLPAGLSENTIYFVISATTNTFQLSTSSGGSAIDITDTGTGTHSFVTSINVPDMRGSVVVGKGQKTKTFNFVDGDVDIATEIITVDSNQFLYSGQAVALTTDGVLPTGLSATTYYVIYVSDATIKLATSRANADDGTAVDITAAAGGGTHTLTLSVNASGFAVGGEGGEEKHTIQTEEIASHVHGVTNDGGGGGVFTLTGGNAVGTVSDTSAAGGDTPHNNMQPFVVANWIIKT